MEEMFKARYGKGSKPTLFGFLWRFNRQALLTNSLAIGWGLNSIASHFFLGGQEGGNESSKLNHKAGSFSIQPTH